MKKWPLIQLIYHVANGFSKLCQFDIYTTYQDHSKYIKIFVFYFDTIFSVAG